MSDKVVIQRAYADVYLDRLGNPFYGYRAQLVEGIADLPILIGGDHDPILRSKTVVPRDRIGHHIERALEVGELQYSDSVLIRCVEERPAKWKFQFSLLTPMYAGFVVTCLNESTITQVEDLRTLTFDPKK